MYYFVGILLKENVSIFGQKCGILEELSAALCMQLTVVAASSVFYSALLCGWCLKKINSFFIAVIILYLIRIGIL